MTIFSANTGFLWPDIPFADRILEARNQGFGAIEFHDEAQSADLDLIAERLAQTGLPLVGMNTRMGETAGCAAIPGEEIQAQADFDAALAIADRLDARAIHIMSGKTDAPNRVDVLVTALTRFASQTDRTLLIEPLAPVAVPGYALSRIATAAQVVARVGAPNVKIMFDTFHIAATETDIVDAYAQYRDHIGHVQIAAPEDRGAPHDNALIRDFVTMIDRDFIGCEWRDHASTTICPRW